MDSQAPGARHGRDLLIALGLCGALIPLLAVVPYWFPHPATPAGDVLADGYNNGVAYALVVLFVVAAIALFAIAGRRGWLVTPAIAAPQAAPAAAADRWTYLVLPAAVLVAYWPWFLAAQGPYVEDNYLLGFLFRLQCGQVPYRDFEYNYSPLSLYLPHLWMRAGGLSLASYYGLTALLEAAKFGLLLAVLQRYVPERRTRWLYAALIAPAFLNTLLGWNYNGIRQGLPVLIVAVVAARPRDPRSALLAGAAAGFLLGYSHDYGLFALAAVGAIHALRCWRERDLGAVRQLGLTAAIAITLWGLSTVLTLGGDAVHYVIASLDRARAYNAGEWNLPFYWTVDALGRFGLILVACYLIGRGWSQNPSAPLASGDLLLWGGLAYALAALKGGMHRPDIWHIAPPFLVLVFAFLLPWPRTCFRGGLHSHRIALALIGLTSFTYLAAQAPTVSYVANGWRTGFQNWLAGDHTAAPAPARRQALENERRPPRAAALRLAAFLAEPAHAARPVAYYHRAWPLDKMVGACSAIYPATGDLLSEDMGLTVREVIRRTPDMLIVIEKASYAKLLGRADDSRPPADYHRDTPTKQVLSWLSTIHFRAAEAEAQRADARWARTVGHPSIPAFAQLADFDEWVVLGRRTLAADARRAAPTVGRAYVGSNARLRSCVPIGERPLDHRGVAMAGRRAARASSLARHPDLTYAACPMTAAARCARTRHYEYAIARPRIR